MLATSKFYTFRQNNSGGVFRVNEEVANFVLIEAISSSHANELAETHEIYFNGCESERDCECCGDRWSPVNEDDGNLVPLICGQPADETSKQVIIHYLDGTSKYINWAL